MHLLLYKCIQLTAVSVFCVVISDHRRKKQTVPLIHPRSALFTKCCYPTPILTLIWVVVRLEAITALDWWALWLSLAGIGITIKAKLDLGDRHSWAGYRIENATPIAHGIYRYLRHPMYAGISLVIMAGTIVIAQRLPWWLTAVIVLINLWIVGFLVIAAQREMVFLRQQKQQLPVCDPR
jgi:protein-S-isoprenylcysteine O-methyltransferase Ste14